MLQQATISVAGVNTANTILANLKAAAANRIRLIEVAVWVETAPSTPWTLQLERMNAVGTGTITSTAAAAADPGDSAGAAVLETAWATTKPTRLGTPLGLRRCQLATSIGSGWIWDFTNRPLVIAASGGLMLNQVSAAGTTLGLLGASFVWDE